MIRKGLIFDLESAALALKPARIEMQPSDLLVLRQSLNAQHVIEPGPFEQSPRATRLPDRIASVPLTASREVKKGTILFVMEWTP